MQILPNLAACFGPPQRNALKKIESRLPDKREAERRGSVEPFQMSRSNPHRSGSLPAHTIKQSAESVAQRAASRIDISRKAKLVGGIY
jgi:hypothetical protein